MYFQSMQLILPAGPRSRDWLSALAGLVQCRRRPHRTFTASTSPSLDRPRGDPLRLLPVRGQSLHRLQSHLPQTHGHPNVDPPGLLRQSSGTRTCGRHAPIGFDVDLRRRTISYIPPNASWKIRDYASAGSTRLRLSGVQSRAHIIRKYTYRSSAVERALAQLADLYVQKGHDLRSSRQALRGKVYVFSALATQRISPRRVRRPRPSVCVTTCF